MYIVEASELCGELFLLEKRGGVRGALAAPQPRAINRVANPCLSSSPPSVLYVPYYNRGTIPKVPCLRAPPLFGDAFFPRAPFSLIFKGSERGRQAGHVIIVRRAKDPL